MKLDGSAARVATLVSEKAFYWKTRNPKYVRVYFHVEGEGYCRHRYVRLNKNHLKAFIPEGVRGLLYRIRTSKKWWLELVKR